MWLCNPNPIGLGLAKILEEEKKKNRNPSNCLEDFKIKICSNIFPSAIKWTTDTPVWKYELVRIETTALGPYHCIMETWMVKPPKALPNITQHFNLVFIDI